MAVSSRVKLIGAAIGIGASISGGLLYYLEVASVSNAPITTGVPPIPGSTAPATITAEAPSASAENLNQSANNTPASPANVDATLPSQQNSGTPENNDLKNTQPEEKKLEVEVPVAPKLFDGNLENLKTKMKSLFFEENFLNKFHNSALKNEPLKVEKKAESTIEKGQISETKILYKTFYLSSVVYENNNIWSVWVNKKRVRDYEFFADGLTIKNVARNSITAEYTTSNFQHVVDLAVSKFEKTNDETWDYISKDGNIRINTKVGQIEFNLKTNQTFSEQSLDFVEGYLAPVEADISKEGAAEDKAPLTENTEGAAPAPSTEVK